MDYDRLAEEWGVRRVRVLRVDCNESLAATIERSLASPTFWGPGSDAHDLFSVIAFFLLARRTVADCFPLSLREEISCTDSVSLL